jgi:glycerol-3-phosphate dehydrogenase
MACLLADAESAGAALAVHSRAAGADLSGRRKLLTVEDPQTGQASMLSARWLVNAAGEAGLWRGQRHGLLAAPTAAGRPV